MRFYGFIISDSKQRKRVDVLNVTDDNRKSFVSFITCSYVSVSSHRRQKKTILVRGVKQKPRGE